MCLHHDNVIGIEWSIWKRKCWCSNYKNGAVRVIIMLHRVIKVLFNWRWGTKREKVKYWRTCLWHFWDVSESLQRIRIVYVDTLFPGSLFHNLLFFSQVWFERAQQFECEMLLVVNFLCYMIHIAVIFQFWLFCISQVIK